MAIVYALLAIFGGMLFPVQAAINAQLGRLVGGPVFGTMISFVVGLGTLALVLLATARNWPDIGPFRDAPTYLYVGGVLGATFLGLSVFLVSRIGAGTFMCLAIAGQILTSMVLDQFGLFGLPAREPSLIRIGGALLVVLGVFMVRFY